jgi:site-specific DNA-methyltransferase (adenine-specific)
MTEGIQTENTTQIVRYIRDKTLIPLLICGDALDVLKCIPSSSINMVITSPPYWGKREYSNGGIGQEEQPDDFIKSLLQITAEVHRVLKSDGSFWLNIGDTYKNKSLVGIPWRVALAMMAEQKWLLRNEIIWNKVKGGMDNSLDKLGNVHEQLFHFVKQQKYYYNIDAIRNKPHHAFVHDGRIVSATGVSGVKYRRQIELSTALTEREKTNAMKDLEKILRSLQDGLIADFRMIIRGQQRTTHSDSVTVSGRAKELKEKGYYFLRYHPNGSKPRDVWDILPEDSQNRKSHFAPFPTDLCKIPILATCPSPGIVLDPFVGTGTSTAIAYEFNCKSIGIDISPEYIEIANRRISPQDLLEAAYA